MPRREESASSWKATQMYLQSVLKNFATPKSNTVIMSILAMQNQSNNLPTAFHLTTNNGYGKKLTNSSDVESSVPPKAHGHHPLSSSQRKMEKEDMHPANVWTTEASTKGP